MDEGPHRTLPADPHFGSPSDEPSRETYRAFLNTEEGRAYVRVNLPVNGDGSFRIESVPPGDYQLTISVAGPAVGRPSEPDVSYASGGAWIEVKPTADERDDQPQSLGTINLQMQDPQIEVASKAQNCTSFCP